MKDKKKRGVWSKTRKFLNDIHLWLGIGSGLILFVVCLTGTIYTFSTEIQKMTDSHLYSVDVPENAVRLSVADLIKKLPDSLSRGVVQSVMIPDAANVSYQLVIVKPGVPGGKASQVNPEQRKGQGGPPKGGQGGRGRGTTYFVNPYTGELLGGGETTSSAFFMTMFRLHRWLLLDTEIGRPIVGVATIIFVVIILSGMVIWFPKKLKNWKQGLKIKTSANWKRINHDLHNALGIYSSLILLVMALTGLTWSFQWYKDGFNQLFGKKERNSADVVSVYSPGLECASVERLVAAAEIIVPYAGEYRVNLPSDSTGVVTVAKTGTSFFATSVSDRVVLDQYSATIISSELFRDKPLNEQILSSIKALHIGSFLGTFSKIIYFFACLIATSLPVTGVIIWINKLRKKREKRREQNSSLVAENIAQEAEA